MINTTSLRSLTLILITAAFLTLFAALTCFLLTQLYWERLGVPIGLQGGLFFLRVIPYVFVLSIPYGLAMYQILSRRGIADLRQFVIVFVIGSFAIFLILAIIFPCDVEPYFVGGYLIRRWFGGS